MHAAGDRHRVLRLESPGQHDYIPAGHYRTAVRRGLLGRNIARRTMKYSTQARVLYDSARCSSRPDPRWKSANVAGLYPRETSLTEIIARTSATTTPVTILTGTRKPKKVKGSCFCLKVDTRRDFHGDSGSANYRPGSRQRGLVHEL